MSKKADRLDRLESKLDEVIALLRMLVLRGGGAIPSDDDVDIPIPSLPPQLPPTLPPVSPANPIYPEPWKFPQTPDLTTKCSKCGMEFNGLMGYVCRDPFCPMGCGPVTCNVE